MEFFGSLDDLFDLAAVFAGQHPNLINVRLDHGRARLNPAFQQFPAGIKNHLFSGILCNLDQMLIGIAFQPLWHAS